MPRLKEIRMVAKAFRKEHRELRQVSDGEAYFLEMLEARVNSAIQDLRNRMDGIPPIRAYEKEVSPGEQTCPHCGHPQATWSKTGSCRYCHRKVA